MPKSKMTRRASWVFSASKGYRGAIAEFWDGMFAHHHWVCEHSHPDHDSATQCGRDHAAEHDIALES